MPKKTSSTPSASVLGRLENPIDYHVLPSRRKRPSGGIDSSSSSSVIPQRRYMRPLSGIPTSVVSEEAYTAGLSNVIERTYFPDVPRLQQQLEWLEALESGDASEIARLSLKLSASVKRTDIIAGIPTPRLGGSSSSSSSSSSFLGSSQIAVTAPPPAPEKSIVQSALDRVRMMEGLDLMQFGSFQQQQRHPDSVDRKEEESTSILTTSQAAAPLGGSRLFFATEGYAEPSRHSAAVESSSPGSSSRNCPAVAVEGGIVNTMGAAAVSSTTVGGKRRRMASPSLDAPPPPPSSSSSSSSSSRIAGKRGSATTSHPPPSPFTVSSPKISGREGKDDDGDDDDGGDAAVEGVVGEEDDFFDDSVSVAASMARKRQFGHGHGGMQDEDASNRSGGGGPPSLDPLRASRHMSLSAYQNQFTSDDNASFSANQEATLAARRRSHWWLYEPPNPAQHFLLLKDGNSARAAPSLSRLTEDANLLISDRGGRDMRDVHLVAAAGDPKGVLASWPHRPKNALFFPPDLASSNAISRVTQPKYNPHLRMLDGSCEIAVAAPLLIESGGSSSAFPAISSSSSASSSSSSSSENGGGSRRMMLAGLGSSSTSSAMLTAPRGGQELLQKRGPGTATTSSALVTIAGTDIILPSGHRLKAGGGVVAPREIRPSNTRLSHSQLHAALRAPDEEAVAMQASIAKAILSSGSQRGPKWGGGGVGGRGSSAVDTAGIPPPGSSSPKVNGYSFVSTPALETLLTQAGALGSFNLNPSVIAELRAAAGIAPLPLPASAAMAMSSSSTSGGPMGSKNAMESSNMSDEFSVLPEFRIPLANSRETAALAAETRAKLRSKAISAAGRLSLPPQSQSFALASEFSGGSSSSIAAAASKRGRGHSTALGTPAFAAAHTGSLGMSSILLPSAATERRPTSWALSAAASSAATPAAAGVSTLRSRSSVRGPASVVSSVRSTASSVHPAITAASKLSPAGKALALSIAKRHGGGGGSAF